MLSLGLKIVWFCLSLTGLISCWVTLLAFARAVKTYWAPVLYCIGCTMLEGIFCLGMIWEMNPFRMPKSFCIAQTVLIGLGTFIMTGVAAAFSMGTSITVLKPKTWGEDGQSTLAWRHSYAVPVIVFPIVATIVQVAVAAKFHPVSPSDDLHCDYHDPIWMRFLSYAGMPFILTLPCLYLSVMSIIRIWKTNKHIQRSFNPDEYDVDNLDNFTPLPRRPREAHVARAISTPSPSLGFRPEVRREPISPTLTSRKFHLPFSSPSSTLSGLHNPSKLSKLSEDAASDVLDSPVSSSFPTFANPAGAGTVSVDPDGISEQDYVTSQMKEWQETLEAMHQTGDDDKRGSYQWNQDLDNKSDYAYVKEMDHNGQDDLDSEFSSPPIRRRAHRRPPPSLAPAIVRLIVFSGAFALIQTLASLSTLVDVIRNKPPMPFGSQHVALLLAAWGPLIIFGHLLAVRRRTFCRSGC